MTGFTTGLIGLDHTAWMWLVEVSTSAGWLRYNSSQWDLTWNGHTWLAGDRVLSIEPASEDMSGQVNGAVLTVSSLDPATTSLALSESLEGRVGNLYIAVLNPGTYQIAEVQRFFSGRVSNLILTKVGEGG